MLDMAFLRHFCILILLVVQYAQADFMVSQQDMVVHVDSQQSFILYLTKPLSRNALATIDIQHTDLVSTVPSSFNISTSDKQWNIVVKGHNAGHSIISLNVTPNDVAESFYGIKCSIKTLISRVYVFYYLPFRLKKVS